MMTEKTLEQIINEEQGDPAPEATEEKIEEPKSFDFGFIMAETGEGNVEDYLEHPLNFNQSVGLARILRGLTGMLGNLRLAIIDIGFGLLEMSKERRGNHG